MKNERYIAYDIMRIIACFGVIMIHCAVFEQEALEAIVDKAIERKTGARGLRSIIEEIMRDIMFEIPSNPNIEKCIITKATVSDNAEPKKVINENKERL